MIDNYMRLCMAMTAEQIENMDVSLIPKIKKPTQEDTPRRQVATHINPNNFYEIQSHGKTIDIKPTLAAAMLEYNGRTSNNKAIYHNVGGKKCLVTSKLG